MKLFIFATLSLLYPVLSYADESALLTLFQGQNKNISEVQMLEYVSNYERGGGLLVARGIKPADNFTGNWNDELFGVFKVDKKMKVIKALEYVPTKRWHDYCVEVSRVPSRFKVRFYGCSYFDQELVREYKIE